MKQLNRSQLARVVKSSLSEDIGRGDITSNAVVSKDQKANAVILMKEAGIIAGLPIVKEVFRQVNPSIKFVAKIKDGEGAKKGKVIAVIAGPARGILAGERVSLNFLQRLSGIATLTDQFVARVKGQGARILDTRKTTPGLRMLEKYAVRKGGGTNHRFGLFDAVLIKDNHIALAGGIKRAVEGLRRPEKAKKAKMVKKAIEVEAKSLVQVEEAIEAGADKILLDNMDLKTLRKAVKLCKKAGVWTEASGGVNLKTVRKIAKTGVNAISVGALTHSARALDISLEMV